MSKFQMCEDCRREYGNHENRRFHAEPIACERCGPALTLVLSDRRYAAASPATPIASVIELLKQGAIAAIKGIGGFHLVCDALNNDAVKRLRERKKRQSKPFAMMAATTDSIKEFAHVSDKERTLLTSPRRPIVLLRKKDSAVSPLVSGRVSWHGFMLPCAPLHYLLFYHPSGLAAFKALVATSGNHTGEPIITENDEALDKLSGVADVFLLNDRDIHMGCDDSVVRITEDGLPIFIRRSRGYVAEALRLDIDGTDGMDGMEVLAYGGDLKNTFTLLKGHYAFPSPYHGDMEMLSTVEFFNRNLKNMSAIFNINPAIAACDAHPGYAARAMTIERGAPETVFIQHHHAHALSVMAERGLSGDAVAVILDGTGYGADGNTWGGEFLVAHPYGFKRAGHFKYMPLPGGDKAAVEPRRMAVAYVADAFGDRAMHMLKALGLIERHGKEFIDTILKIIPIRELSPPSSSAGRLFDAAASIITAADINTYEGQAPMELESIVSPGIDESYPYGISDGAIVDFSAAIKAIVSDVIEGAGKGRIAAMFHNTVVAAITDMAMRICDTTGLKDVLLSGGTFQNAYLLDNTVRRLKASGLNVYTNEKVPCNDGGISLGQAYGARRLRCAQTA